MFQDCYEVASIFDIFLFVVNVFGVTVKRRKTRHKQKILKLIKILIPEKYFFDIGNRPVLRTSGGYVPKLKSFYYTTPV